MSDASAVEVEFLFLFSNERSINIYLKVFKCRTLSDIQKTIFKILEQDSIYLSDEEQCYYYLEHNRKKLAMNISLENIKVENGSVITMKLARNSSPSTLSASLTYESNSNDDELIGEELTLLCITRIFESDGEPIRKVRVLVNSLHPCKFLIKDVSTHWNKSNLKFKFGRTVLIPEKSFADLGILNNAEISVTGGRS
eukprot:gene6118-8433_t